MRSEEKMVTMQRLPKGIQRGNYPDGSEELSLHLSIRTDLSAWRSFLLENQCTFLRSIRHLLVSCDGQEENAPDFSAAPIRELLQSLSRALPNIIGIHLENLGIQKEFPISLLAKFLTSLLPKGLEYLRLEFAKLNGSRSDILAFAEAIRQQKSLQSFQLQDVILSVETLRSTCSLDSVVTVLAALPKMERIHIRALPVDEPIGSLGLLGYSSFTSLFGSSSVTGIKLENFGLDEKHIASMANALSSQQPQTIHTIEVSYSTSEPISSQTWQLLANALKESHCLEIFRFGVFHDPNPMLRELASGLSLHPTLQELAVFGGDGEASDVTAETFVAMLESSNVVLRMLQLPRYYGEWLPKLELYLKLNCSGLRQLLKARGEEMNRREQIDWTSVLASISGDMDCVFYLLRANPTSYFC